MYKDLHGSGHSLFFSPPELFHQSLTGLGWGFLGLGHFLVTELSHCLLQLLTACQLSNMLPLLRFDTATKSKVLACLTVTCTM